MTRRKALVYTRYDDGGISVCYPTAEAFRFMTMGGGYWNDRPRGFLDELVRRKTCPDLQKKRAVTDEAKAWRFVKAMQFGGCTTAEAWDIIAGHDCARFGHLIDLQDVSELPDRWFRDAWYRSPNGGPVSIDLGKARPIQWKRIKAAVHRENKRRDLDFYSPGTLVVPWVTVKSAIKHARDTDELRKVWPEGLNVQH